MLSPLLLLTASLQSESHVAWFVTQPQRYVQHGGQKSDGPCSAVAPCRRRTKSTTSVRVLGYILKATTGDASCHAMLSRHRPADLEQSHADGSLLGEC